jgi:hypothetical protein
MYTYIIRIYHTDRCGWWWWYLLRYNYTSKIKNNLPYVKYRPARKGISTRKEQTTRSMQKPNNCIYKLDYDYSLKKKIIILRYFSDPKVRENI